MIRETPFAPGEIYHLYNRGVDKRDIYLDEYDRQRFLSLLYLCNTKTSVHLQNFFHTKTEGDIFREDLDEPLVAVGAYCLMDNHFHLLVKELVENGISTYMKKVGTAYAMYFNSKNKRSGALFQGRFKSIHAGDDRYLKYLYSYIHLNPAKLVDKGWSEHKITNPKETEKYINEYVYSSFSEYAFPERMRPQKNILNMEEFPDYFENVNEFKKIHKEWLNFDQDFTPTTF